MAFAEEHGESPAVFRRVGNAMASTDGERAMQWLATLPEGPERQTAVASTYRNWIGNDREAAMRWMRGQEVDPWLDPAVHSFAQALAFEDPALGLAWAAQISDPRRREDATWRVATVWAERDPAAYQTWFDSADIPDALKQRIARTVRKSAAARAPATESRGNTPAQAPGKTAAPGPDA